MIPTRIVHNIFRRLSSGDGLFTQQLNYSTCQASIVYKNADYENLSPVRRRSFPVYANLIQVRDMSSEPSNPSSSVEKKENRLALENSPYLLQHATNPVDWFPWCEEAFEKARNENKLIFLSVGYSTCHWCHVMEKESFEDDSVAEIMNKYYVNIKLDREERPDIDRVYMSFIQATSGSGGWPMSVFLTPNLEPISGGTYFPPEDKWGRPGFKTILTSIAERWAKDKDSILESGKHILSVLKKASERELQGGPKALPGEDSWIRCVEQFTRSYEPEFGGFSESPKFPQPSNFNFLFHLYSRDKDTEFGKDCLQMALHTLKCMAKGGIHDHISNGFARYSTDSNWHVPHFEKMLYDQAQLVVSYCDAYVVTKDNFYADAVRDILTYVSRDLSHPSGGFFSAEDADSYPYEGAPRKREGAFCVWEHAEILSHLTDKTKDVAHADVFCHHFGIKKQGNVDPAKDPHNELTKKNVLIVYGSVESTADFFKLSVDDVNAILEKSRKILYEVRQKRPRPHLDSKILTAWNGLMIAGYAKAAQVLKDQSYIDRAVLAARFIKSNLFVEGQHLLRCCYRGDDGQIVQNSVPILGFLDDYAFLIRGLLELYEATFDGAWLEWAEALQELQDRQFCDEANGGYFTSPEGDTSVLIRVKEDQDGAEPSGNSVSAHNLLKIGAYLDRADLRSRAEKLLTAFAERLRKIPIALPEMTSALMAFRDSPTQVFIVGSANDPATEALLDVVRSRLLPGRLLVQGDGPGGSGGLLYSRLEVLSRLRPQGGRPTAYVCRHYACSLPVTEPGDLRELLDEEMSGHGGK